MLAWLTTIHVHMTMGCDEPTALEVIKVIEKWLEKLRQPTGLIIKKDHIHGYL